MKKENKTPNKYLLYLFAFVVGSGVGYLIAYISSIKPSIIPITSALIGFFVALIVPFWQAKFVNAPKLSVEINAIRRTVSDTALISIDEEPELRSLKNRHGQAPYILGMDYNEIVFEKPNKRGGYTLSQTEELLADAKQRLRDLPTQIEERKKELDRVASLTPQTLTKYECDKLNGPISPEVEYEQDEKDKMIDSFRDAYQKRLDGLEKRYAELQSNLPAMERKIEILKKELVDNRSFFTVSASLINSGRTNTAIKVPALLRVSIGEGNYIDLKLSLKDFENKSEISANGTRIITFESSEVSSLPEEDRKLINTYWGQSVSSRLLLEDIHSSIYSSNTIAFAEGLYQKIIYDRLARAASTDFHSK